MVDAVRILKARIAGHAESSKRSRAAIKHRKEVTRRHEPCNFETACSSTDRQSTRMYLSRAVKIASAPTCSTSCLEHGYELLHERRFRWYSRSLPFCRLNARQRRCGGYYGMCNLSGECIADLRETWHSTYRTEHARPDARLLPVLPKRLVMVAFWTQCLWWYGTLYRKTVRKGAR